MPRANELQEQSVPWPSNKSMTKMAGREKIWTNCNYVHNVSVQFKTFYDADGVTRIRRNDSYNISTAVLVKPQPTQSHFHVATIYLGCAGAVWGTWQKGPRNGYSPPGSGHLCFLRYGRKSRCLGAQNDSSTLC